MYESEDEFEQIEDLYDYTTDFLIATQFATDFEAWRFEVVLIAARSSMFAWWLFLYFMGSGFNLYGSEGL